MFKESKKKLTELKSATNPLMKDFREIESKIAAKTKEIVNQETGFKRIKAELDALNGELKKNEEEEGTFAASARKQTKQELFPDKTVKQLNAKLVQLRKRRMITMQKENENVETFVEEYNELRCVVGTVP